LSMLGRWKGKKHRKRGGDGLGAQSGRKKGVGEKKNELESQEGRRTQAWSKLGKGGGGGIIFLRVSWSGKGRKDERLGKERGGNDL